MKTTSIARQRQKNNLTGVTGVSPHLDGGFTAKISAFGSRIYLGYFYEFDDAVEARRSAEKALASNL